jgi:hypothetical protein
MAGDIIPEWWAASTRIGTQGISADAKQTLEPNGRNDAKRNDAPMAPFRSRPCIR